jgi:hypothetical protein
MPPANAGALGRMGGGGGVEGPSTGDRQLDRASQIDISRIRDARVGGASSGVPDTHAGPAGGPPTPDNVNGQVADGAGAGAATGAPPAAAGAAGAGPTDQPKPAAQEPVYKKWWFWAVVGVSAIVVYEIATDNSSSATGKNVGREQILPLGTIGGKGISAEPGGLTLRF